MRNITEVCRGRQKTAYGFKWKYDKGEERDETWRDIPDLDGYQVSSKGNVRNSHKLLILSTNDRGYKCLTIDNKYYRVNRLVARTYTSYIS